MVIEGTLGLTAFNFITRYLEDSGQLPGFVDGYSKIHHDEQRHIGYGTWFLREAVRRDPALADSVRTTLRELLPAVAESLTPPDRDDTDWDALGAELRRDPRLRDLGAHAAAQDRRRAARLAVSQARPNSPAARPPRDSRRSRSCSRAAARSSPTRTTHGALGTVGVALVFGLVIMVMVYATGHLSGAHINPAVTVAFTLTRHFPARDAVAYIAAQLAGAVAGALLLLAVWTEQAGRARRDGAERRHGQRARLRGRADRVPDVRDHGRGHRHAGRGRRGRDRDRRHRRARRAVRRPGHRRVHESRPARSGPRSRPASGTTSGSTWSAPSSAPRWARSPTSSCAANPRWTPARWPRVLFVCLHNAGRSQMSAALFERAAGGTPPRAESAGTTPGERVHPEVVDGHARARHRPGRPRAEEADARARRARPTWS